MPKPDYVTMDERIKQELNSLVEKQKAILKCKVVKFTDVGKEIYQMEVPKAVKVPGSWRQMSATSSVKRYYFRELEDLVRELQEAEEDRWPGHTDDGFPDHGQGQEDG